MSGELDARTFLEWHWFPDAAAFRLVEGTFGNRQALVKSQKQVVKVNRNRAPEERGAHGEGWWTHSSLMCCISRSEARRVLYC